MNARAPFLLFLSIFLAAGFGLHTQVGSEKSPNYILYASPVFSLPVSACVLDKYELLSAGWGGRFATGVSKDLGSKFALRGFADAGLVNGFLSMGDFAAYVGLRVGARIEYKINERLSTRFDADLNYQAGLYAGLGAGLGIAYRLPSRDSGRIDPSKLRLLDFSAVKTAEIFPIFRAYYDKQSLGSVTITNTSREPVTKVRLNFLLRQYMDAPKECAPIPRMEAGEGVLRITEATEATAEITVSYDAGEVAGASQSCSSTAFATVPCRIFMAAELGLTEAEAKARCMDIRELISVGDRLWIPIETTLRSSGFLAAWRKAAEEWHQASAEGRAAFHPIH